MTEIDFNALTGCMTLVMVGVYSFSKYQKLNSNYAATRIKVSSDSNFRYVYRYIQLSSFTVTLIAYTADYSWLLKFHHSAVFIYAGISMTIAGLLIFNRALVDLSSEYSPCFDLRSPTEIVSHGVYAYIRHPIYSGNILMLFGFFISTGSFLIGINVCILAVYYYRSAQIEDRISIEVSEEYKHTMSSVGMFFPKVKI